MILASDFATKAYGAIRVVLMWIDSLGFYVIDNAYNIMIRAMEGFNQEAIQQIAGKMTRSAYVLMGIFALFRIAIMLINAIINPDKLTDKKEGAGNVLFHFVGTIFLLIFIPFIFDMGRDLQSTIIKGNYIPKFILGQEIASGSSSNAGAMLQRITVKSMIRPDDRLADRETSYEYIDSGTGLKTGETCSKDNLNKPKSKEEKNIICQEITEYKANSECSNNNECKKAVDNWVENKVRFRTLSKYIDSYVKVNGEAVFVYEYTPFLTLVVGLFMTYVLVSFTIDIAVRSVELLVLEVLSPLFTITFIDPKMASSGPFKKWVTATGKSYASLFIKVAIISLMLLLLSNLHTLVNSVVFGSENNWLMELFMVLAILIFAKKAPKWLGDMLGLSDNAGLGGLGIGKKLAGAALVGGALTKAGHTALGAAAGGASSLYNHARNRKLQRKKIREDGGFTHGLSGHKKRQQYSKDNGGYLAGRREFKKARKDAYKNQGVRRTQIGRSLKEAGATLVQGTITGSLSGLEAKDAKAALSAGNKSGIDAIKENHYGYQTGSERARSTLQGVSGRFQDKVFGDEYERSKKLKDAENAQLQKDFYKNLPSSKTAYRPVKDEEFYIRYGDRQFNSDIIKAATAEGTGLKFKIGNDNISDIKLNGDKLSANVNGTNMNLTGDQIKEISKKMVSDGMLSSAFQLKADAYASQSALNLANNSQGLAQQQATIINNINQVQEAKSNADAQIKAIEQGIPEFQALRKQLDKIAYLQQRSTEVSELESQMKLMLQQKDSAELRGDTGAASAIQTKIEDIKLSLGGDTSTNIGVQLSRAMSDRGSFESAFLTAKTNLENTNSNYKQLITISNQYDSNLMQLQTTASDIGEKLTDVNATIVANIDKFKDSTKTHAFGEGYDAAVIANLQESNQKAQKRFDEQKDKVLGKDKK